MVRKIRLFSKNRGKEHRKLFIDWQAEKTTFSTQNTTNAQTTVFPSTIEQ